MTYKINGEEVSREEFLSRKVGIDFDRPCNIQASSFQPFQSPIDFKMINNRQDLANHNRQHNVEQVGNEYIDNPHKYKR